MRSAKRVKLFSYILRNNHCNLTVTFITWQLALWALIRRSQVRFLDGPTGNEWETHLLVSELILVEVFRKFRSLRRHN